MPNKPRKIVAAGWYVSAGLFFVLVGIPAHWLDNPWLRGVSVLIGVICLGGAAYEWWFRKLPVEVTTAVEPPAERIILDIDVAVLIGIKNNTLTIAEKQRLWKPYVGKWIVVSGPVADVSETKLLLANYRTPAAGLLQLVLKFETTWSDRLSVIQKGSNVAVLGRIADFMSSCVILDRCELIL